MNDRHLMSFGRPRSRVRIWRAAWLAAACFLLVRPAHAALTYELVPAVGAGVTDNVTVTPASQDHVADGFTTLSAGARVHYEGARTTQGLGYKFTQTHFLFGHGSDLLSHELGWVSAYTLSTRLTLHLTATGALSRTSALTAIDPVATTATTATFSGVTKFYTLGASEDLSFTPDPRQNYGQSLSVLRFRPYGSNSDLAGLASTSIITLAGHGGYLVGRNSFVLDASLADSLTRTNPTAAGTPVSAATLDIDGHTLIAIAMLGWGRELSPTWTTLLQAGPSAVRRPSGTGVLAPAAGAHISYIRAPWFAGLSLTQAPAPNLYIGGVTITDQVLAKLAVPLTRSELYYVGGFGAYAYSRFAGDATTTSTTRAYDQILGGASLIAKARNMPLAATLSYTVLSQRGSNIPGRPIADLARQAIILTISGTFGWGPGTPPLFGSVL